MKAAERGGWLSLHGRISRSRYWLHYVIPLTAPLVVSAYLFPQSIALFVVWGATFALWLFGAVKRLHDHNGPGWILVAVFPGGVAGWWIAGRIGDQFPLRPYIDGAMVNEVALVASTVLLFGWLAFGMFLAFARGTVGPNRFGPDPCDAIHDLLD